jgi:dTDP-4-dehydrorhamnose 3,5-epimerase
MKITPLPLNGLTLIEAEAVSDDRGFFFRQFCQKELNSIMGLSTISQINRSVTHRAGTIRGLHYQRAPFSETKFISCLRGAVYDVAVDLRQNSLTYGQFHSERLVAGDGKQFVLPEGFAHGFQALENDTELLYLHTAPYSRDHEGGVRYDDPQVKIVWPLPPRDLSPRDLSLNYLPAAIERSAAPNRTKSK